MCTWNIKSYLLWKTQAHTHTHTHTCTHTKSYNFCYSVLLLHIACWVLNTVSYILAGPGGSVGCAVQLETRRLWVQPLPRLATFFCGDWSWNIFCGHSLPSADGQLSVSGERMCTILVNHLEDLNVKWVIFGTLEHYNIQFHRYF